MDPTTAELLDSAARVVNAGMLAAVECQRARELLYNERIILVTYLQEVRRECALSRRLREQAVALCRREGG